MQSGSTFTSILHAGVYETYSNICSALSNAFSHFPNPIKKGIDANPTIREKNNTKG